MYGVNVGLVHSSSRRRIISRRPANDTWFQLHARYRLFGPILFSPFFREIAILSCRDALAKGDAYRESSYNTRLHTVIDSESTLQDSPNLPQIINHEKSQFNLLAEFECHPFLRFQLVIMNRTRKPSTVSCPDGLIGYDSFFVWDLDRSFACACCCSLS